MPMAGSDDHYYWLTSLITSRHLEKQTCRLIAATVFLLGLVPLLLTVHEVGPQATVRTAVAGAITLCSSTIAALWAVRCWPTRGQSRGSAIAGIVCVTAAIAVIPDPLVAALGGLAFAGPAGFTALFHTRRMLILTWSAAAVVLAVSAWRLADVNVALAAVVLPLVVLINAFAGYAWLLATQLTDAKVSSSLMDPLTGLLNRAAFDERASVILGARDRVDDRHLVIAVISVDTYGLLMSLGQTGPADRACIAAARQLSSTLRRETVLAHRGNGDFMVAEVFTSADPSALTQRICGSLTDRPARLSASVGAVSTPLSPLAGYPVNDVLDELLHLADQARNDARRGGGDAARCIINPPLSTLGDAEERPLS